MSYNLFLDDFRQPADAFQYTHNSTYLKLKWRIVRSYDEFVAFIEKNGIPDLISFDHDLADEHYKKQASIDYTDEGEKTGYHCAKWFINYCIDNKKELPKMILIHSMNVYGSENIKSLFLSYYKVKDLPSST